MIDHLKLERCTRLAAALLVAGCAAPDPDSSGGASPSAGAGETEIDRALESIDHATLRSHIAYLSSDDLEGRGPATEGDRVARLYLAEQMQALGLEPAAADGGWEQPFAVVSIDSKAPETWAFAGPAGSVELAFWDDFIAWSGVERESSAIDGAELVFVGYGIQAPEYLWDDYKDVDVRGKVLVMLNNDPDWDPDLFAGKTRLYYGRWTYKYEIAAELGAAGAIIIHTTPSAGYPYQVVQTSWTGPQFKLPAAGEPTTEVEAFVTEESARRLMELAGHDLHELVESARAADFRPVDLGLTTSIALQNTVEEAETANVLGLLRGSDPELADEVVVYTAHHDHIGVGKPNDDGDAIYNGALDNASGTATVLAIAKAFTELPQPPRRSLLFLFVAAEEQGLLGSAYYARNPTFPPGRFAANINHDGANIWGRTRDLTYIGYGKSSLDAVVDRHAAAQGRTVFPDQFPDRGFFYRSDQFNFAKIGVPAIYLDTGTDFVDRPEGWGKEQIEAWEEHHYHQPSDELEDDWNYEGMIEDAELSFRCGYDIAQTDELPTWNPGDEFEAARKEALAALAGGS